MSQGFVTELGLKITSTETEICVYFQLPFLNLKKAQSSKQDPETSSTCCSNREENRGAASLFWQGKYDLMDISLLKSMSTHLVRYHS